ncbi:MAG: hypothetical protein VX874_21435 [Pseudomonadota bacterium]|nr:hypothetical protein [Pseudomonadota bacterium]
MVLNFAIGLAVLVVGAALWLPGLRRRDTWRAMITPLASIIGSGFLVLGPILEHAYGGWAPAIMAALCIVAWGYGAAVRHNIAVIDARPEAASGWTETLASALLGFAFTISVAYYLNLFGAFGLSLTPWDTPTNARLLTTAIYAVILFTGFTRGFEMLERMEYASVALKLAIIAGLFVGLAHYNAVALATQDFHIGAPTVAGWGALTLAFGLIVTVQGFETSRYLGGTYSAATRIRSMRWAQMLSTVIYMIYIGFVAYTFEPSGVDLKETAIVDMMAVVAPILPLLLVAAALAAQFSAAVADTGGSGGLIAELSRHRLKPREAYVIVGVIGLALTWFSDVFSIIAYASRAFAAYYAVQAFIAARTAKGLPRVTFAGLAILGLSIAIFGQPVE